MKDIIQMSSSIENITSASWVSSKTMKSSLLSHLMIACLFVTCKYNKASLSKLLMAIISSF